MQGTLPQDGSIQPNTEKPTRLPTHQVVYQRLREAVLFGELAPGEPVTIQGLIERTGAGMTPIREAIRRLTSEGALEFRGNRRVLVPMPTPEAIEELIFLRETLEPQLAARAAEKATKADIAALDRIDSALDEAITRGDVVAYLRQNHAFHMKLNEIADAPILADVVGSVWLRFGPAMRVVCGRMGTQNLPDNHKTAIQALREADSKTAAEAIRLDVVQGMEQLLQALKDAEGFRETID